MYYARLCEAKIEGVEYEDVVGELSIAFVNAKNGYNPDAGYVFTTYLGSCMQNHFNKWASRLLIEQYGTDEGIDAEEPGFLHRGLGYVSVESLSDPDGEHSFYDFVEDESQQNPELAVEADQMLAEVINDKALLPETRAYIGYMSNPNVQLSPFVKKRIQDNSTQVRQEIWKRWGVKMMALSL